MKVIGLLGHLNHSNNGITELLDAHGVGIDYNAELVKTAGINAVVEGVTSKWLVYDFNEDKDDLFRKLISTYHVTHVFVYLVPKQLALLTIRTILTKLCKTGVVVCCHKFHPTYLIPARLDTLMKLAVYDETS